MRVFYVRPSDNGNYGVEAALGRLCQPLERLDLALFRGFRVPFQPVNYDPREEGFASLSRYDVVVLAGVDPVVLTPRNHLSLVAFVERGGALFLLGGSHSFGNAEGTYLPLAAILPAEIRRGLDVEVKAPVRPTAHPMARGLPEPLGYVGKVHPIAPRPGAEMVLTAGDFPLAVAGDHGYGRVVLVASYPECEETEYGWFFTGDALDDFLRNAIAWATKRRLATRVESFSLPNRRVLLGSECFCKLALAAPEPTEVRLVARLSRAEGGLVQDETTRVRVDGSRQVLLAFRMPADPSAAGLHYATVGVLGPEGQEMARRDVAVEAVPPVRVVAELHRGRRVHRSKQQLRLRLAAARASAEQAGEAAVSIALADDAGRRILETDPMPLRWCGKEAEPVDVALPLPQLRPAAYRLVAELEADGTLLAVGEEELWVVQESRGDEQFPLIAEGAYHLDRASMERGARSLAAAGVNTLSLPGPVSTEWGERPHWEAMLAHAAGQALRAGLSLAHHRRGLLPGWKPAAPLETCPRAEAFAQMVQERPRRLLAADGLAPRLWGHQVVPQAALRASQVCRCEECREAWSRAHERSMPDGNEGAADLFSFASATWRRAYEAIAEVRDDAAPRVRLALPLTAASFLREGADAPFCDGWAWAETCDIVEVQAEPSLAAYRLSLSGHRVVCRAKGKSMGAAIDLAEDALPPAEAAYTALLHGARHLRVAENPRFLFWRRQRPLEEALGRLFARTARAGPLLARSTRPQACVALVFPATQMMASGTAGLLEAHEYLAAAVGEVDLVDERLAAEGQLEGYRALCLFGSSLLPRAVTEALAGAVRRGAVLLTDRGELTDEQGERIAWPDGFFGTAETHVFEAVTCRRRAFGAGRTILYSPNLLPSYRDALAQEDARAAQALRRPVADALAERHILPRARSGNPHVEVGLRACGATWLLVAVNHAAERQEAQVWLDPEAVVASVAFDLVSGEEQELDGTENPAVLLRLAPGEGALWALYAQRPFTLRMEMPPAPLSAGSELRYRVLVTDEAGQPVRGRHLLRIAVADPQGEPRRDLGGERLASDGVLEVAEPLGINEREGTWTVRATDALTRRIARGSFRLVAGEGGGGR